MPAAAPAMDATQFELLVQLLTDPAFLAVAGGLALVLVVAFVVVVRRLWRRARQLAGAQAHRIDRARTALQAHTLPDGPHRRAAELRHRLAASVAETDRLLGAASVGPLVPAMVGEQHRELARLAAALDEHLRCLQREPDPARVQAALPEARQWTEQLCEIAAALRDSVRASSTATTAADVRALSGSTSDGVAALRAGVTFLQAQVRDHRTGR